MTTRPLVAEGDWPVDQRGATTPLLVDGEVVDCWVRTRAGAKPVAVHAAWQTDAQDAVQVVLAATRRARTQSPCAAPAPWPEPAELAHQPGKDLVRAATRGSGQAWQGEQRRRGRREGLVLSRDSGRE